MTQLVLASQSPRRQELLKLLGHPFTVLPANIEEPLIPGESPEDHVKRLAFEKAEAVGKTLSDSVVIGSDTVVVIDGDILGKPTSRQDALTMLMRLAGRTHKVFTGFALYDTASGHAKTEFESTEVTMRQFDIGIAKRYCDTNEPFDKAGSYGIQGWGAVLIDRIDGCYFTVMGLPLARLMSALHTFTGGTFGYFGMNGGARP